MPRLVRRRPWTERLKDYLNPYDFMIWLSEELETSDYPWEQWAYIGGAGCNLLFMLARANSAYKPYDDIFSDDGPGTVVTTLANVVVYALIAASCTNALYTFNRKRHYRLFEKSVEGAPPNTPSARRVRVDSSPSASTPLRLLTSLFPTTDSADSRAHPDTKRDVWELAVWDPLPSNLRFFCSFSPGHTLLYWLFLPVASTDPRPSTTVATAMFLAALLSSQLILLYNQMAQQARDQAIVNREVMNEYDVKYVHPNTHPVMRDVGVQFDEDHPELNVTEAGTPTTVVHGYSINPNPSYVGLVDPQGALKETPTRRLAENKQLGALRSPSGFTPTPADRSVVKQSGIRASMGTGDGGSLGVYTHPRSPLKKLQNASARKSTGTSMNEGALRDRSNLGISGTPRYRV